MTKGLKYIKKTFLTSGNSSLSSYIISKIHLDKWTDDKKKEHKCLYGELTLGACSSNIHWVFTAENKKSLKNSRSKAKKTRKLLEDFFDKLESEMTEFEKELNIGKNNEKKLP